MRAVPRFTLFARPARAWRRGVALLGAAAGANLGAWLIASGAPAVLAATVAGGLVVAGIAAGRGGAAPLAWTGRGWRLGTGGDAADGTLACCIDLDRFVLLRFVPQGGARPPWRARWLPLAAADCTVADWHLLRCVIHFTPGQPSAAGREPAADG